MSHIEIYKVKPFFEMLTRFLYDLDQGKEYAKSKLPNGIEIRDLAHTMANIKDSTHDE